MSYIHTYRIGQTVIAREQYVETVEWDRVHKGRDPKDVTPKTVEAGERGKIVGFDVEDTRFIIHPIYKIEFEGSGTCIEIRENEIFSDDSCFELIPEFKFPEGFNAEDYSITGIAKLFAANPHTKLIGDMLRELEELRKTVSA